MQEDRSCRSWVNYLPTYLLRICYMENPQTHLTPSQSTSLTLLC